MRSGIAEIYMKLSPQLHKECLISKLKRIEALIH